MPTIAVSTAPAVPIGSPASTPNITGKLGRLATYTSTASVPGDLSGPAVAIPLTLTNTSNRPIDLGGVVVDLVGAGGVPGSPLFGKPASPFTETLAPGASADAVYAFSLDQSARGQISIVVTYEVGQPALLFAGTAP